MLVGRRAKLTAVLRQSGMRQSHRRPCLACDLQTTMLYGDGGRVGEALVRLLRGRDAGLRSLVRASRLRRQQADHATSGRSALLTLLVCADAHAQLTGLMMSRIKSCPTFVLTDKPDCRARGVVERCHALLDSNSVSNNP